ncbi:Endonuclease/Exonuclease/phosphatase family protein [Stieleria maiorica]|uniref:Endonuclease/Exonuclease/phosphatase family protein n=1 Tax=Stieleria maiorica TaxID=2795974 RepID=A0A5B9MPB2_9BACT|nr:endonuclease/exonuclease/phosphatase family protein [Stieleria maiorica]QEG02190.1 Endonuclease/Exonuclease/phosphatase family protein [Stieleria maiorica]
MRRATLILAILYLLLLVIGAALMHTRLNSYWLITVFLFSPRWVVALPLLLLVPLTLVFRRRLAPVYLIHVGLVLFPILDFQLPRFAPASSEVRPTLRVLTCNVGGGTLDDRRLIELLRDHEIDVMMLQECTQAVADPLFEQLGWNRRQLHHVVIASPLELSRPRVLGRQPRNNFHAVAAIGCQLTLPQGERVQLASIHLPTFRPALEKIQHFDFQRGPEAIDRLGQTRRGIAKQVAEAVGDVDLPTMLAGDFNVPVESVFYRDYWGEYQNAFSIAGGGLGYTKYTRLHGIRIDHILADQNWDVLAAHVGPDLGGDHRPVIAEFARRSSQ